jgi:tripartite-type tricarboxylate transporter receptor subunit TctC
MGFDGVTTAMRAALIAAACLFAMVPATAQTVADFYRGKTVSLVVGYPPGGGYDVYARVIARHMGRYLPGQPAMIVRNQPGAASLSFANELYRTHPQDGSLFGTFARSVPMDRLLGRPGTNFDPTKFNWIGSANAEVSICTVWHGLGLKTVREFIASPVIFGANAPGSESFVYPTILNNLLGANFRIVTGYPGAGDLMMAMERGETQGRCGMTWSAFKTTMPEWVRDKKVFIALQFAVEKHPELSEVPLVTELARNDMERDALGLILAGQAMGRPFAAPPNVPEDRIAALRAGFDRTMADPQFLAEGEKQGLEIQPVSGAKLQELVERMFQAPLAAVDAARKAINSP